jgi:hypothetical protein
LLLVDLVLLSLMTVIEWGTVAECHAGTAGAAVAAALGWLALSESMNANRTTEPGAELAVGATCSAEHRADPLANS